MGQFCNGPESSFMAGTLNYSGIMKSPVEYYSESGYKEEKLMN